MSYLLLISGYNIFIRQFTFEMQSLRHVTVYIHDRFYFFQFVTLGRSERRMNVFCAATTPSRTLRETLSVYPARTVLLRYTKALQNAVGLIVVLVLGS